MPDRGHSAKEDLKNPPPCRPLPSRPPFRARRFSSRETPPPPCRPLPSVPLSSSASLSLSPSVAVCRSSPTAAASPREALAGRRRPRAAPASAPAAACACPRPWRGEASPTDGRRPAYPRRCLLRLLRVCSYATSATGNPTCLCYTKP